MGDDIFSCSEEKAGPNEGGSSSNFASIFPDFVSELRLTDALRCKIIVKSAKEKEQCVLLTEIIACAFMILDNPALDLL